MTIIFGFVLALLFLAALFRLFLATPAPDLARQLRRLAAIILILAAIGLAFARQFGLAVPLAVTGYVLWRRQAGMRGGSSGSASSVRSPSLAMELDHDTGEIDGEILQGSRAGARLSELSLQELLDLAGEIGGEADSLRLLEAYLDRRHPGWRDDGEGGDAQRRRAAADPVGMDTKEAYDILGIQPGAGEAEIREAHRRLMKQVHPDRGGSAALAARINEAKEHLIGRHR